MSRIFGLRRGVVMVVLVTLVLGLGFAAGVVATEAINQSDGAVKKISGLDNLTKTIQEYARGPVGKVIATILIMAGMAMALTGRAGMGMTVGACGIGTAFVPSLVNGVYGTAGQEAVAVMASGGVSGSVLLHAVMPFLGGPVIVMRVLSDPLFSGLLLVAVVSVPRVRREIAGYVRLAFGTVKREAVRMGSFGSWMASLAQPVRG